MYVNIYIRTVLDSTKLILTGVATEEILSCLYKQIYAPTEQNRELNEEPNQFE